jgi:hypothetical protein
MMQALKPAGATLLQIDPVHVAGGWQSVDDDVVTFVPSALAAAVQLPPFAGTIVGSTWESSPPDTF